MDKHDWQCVLELDADRSRAAGSESALADAIGRGAELRIGTTFRYNEHIDVTSSNTELVKETCDFRVTYRVDGRWTSAVCTLRQPVLLPTGFGPRPSMSLFLYGQDGRQAIARLYLDGPPARVEPGPAPITDVDEESHGIAKYHVLSNCDVGTNAPSHNFVYDFDVYRYFVRDHWRQVLSHDADGRVIDGSLDDLADAIEQGMDVKVGITGLCDDLAGDAGAGHVMETFAPTVARYYHTDQKLLIAATEPLVRVRPAIPLEYASKAWDCGWAVVRTDGFVARLLYDPYTLEPGRSELRCAIRWFVS